MTTIARARVRSAGIVGACVVALLSMVLSLRAISTQSDVARREATRAVATAEETRAKVDLADCQLLGLFRPRPNEPAPAPGRGVIVAERVEAMWQARGCRP